jgi:hypothetical protein
MILATLENATQGEVQRYENNYKTLNLITTALGINVYDRVSHLEIVYDVWLKLCNTYEVYSEMKSSHKDTYNRQYQTFSQKLGDSLDDCFDGFESIVSNLRSCGPIAYSDNEHAKQLMYALNDHVWGMKIIASKEAADCATLDKEKLFSKLKSHELSRKCHLNHDASLTSKALITSARVGGHDANPTNTVSSSLEFPCLLWLQLLISSMRVSPMMRSLCRQGSFAACTSSIRRGEDHPGAASSAATPPTSSVTTPIGRSSTPPTRMTTPTGMTTGTKTTTRRWTASKTRRRRCRISCPERVLP